MLESKATFVPEEHQKERALVPDLFEQPIEATRERDRRGAAQRHFESHAGKSDFRRELMDDGKWLITSKEGERLYVDTVRSPEDERLGQIHELLLKTFNPEEVDPPEGRAASLEDNKHPDRTGELLVQTISDEGGRLVGFLEARYQPVTRMDGSSGKEGVVMVGYVITDPEARGKGISKELYARLFADVDRVSAERGEQVAYVAGEAVQSVEPILNKFGRGRVYARLEDGSQREFKYMQPPLDWNLETGEKAADADFAPEHFMIGRTDGKRDMRPEEVLDCVRSFYDYLFFDAYHPEDFATPAAYERAKSTVEAQLAAFRAQLEGVQQLSLISSLERRVMKRAGLTFDEHTDADKVQWDEMGEG